MVIDDRLIHKNKYSRPAIKNMGVRGLVVHWTGVPGQDAETVRRYFDKYAPKEKKFVSAHFVIDFDGSILQMIPDDEIAYHASYKDTPDSLLITHGFPNDCMLGIECCVSRPVRARGLKLLLSELPLSLMFLFRGEELFEGFQLFGIYLKDRVFQIFSPDTVKALLPKFKSHKSVEILSICRGNAVISGIDKTETGVVGRVSEEKDSSVTQ